MLAVVKKPRIEISFSGALENVTELLSLIRSKYEVDVLNYEPALEPVEDEEKISVFETDFWKENATPGRIAAGARLKHQLTQAQLAEKSGIPQPSIAAYESGKRPLSRKAAIKIGAALGENPDKFFRHCK